MKKLTSLILLLACVLPSCNNSVTDEDIAKNLDGYETLFDETAADGTTTETEAEYVPTSLTGIDGIFSPEYTVSDNKYYFVTKRLDKRGLNGIDMITYVDLDTGDSHIICPDPLCEHEDDEKCRYTEFQEIYFTDEAGVFYSVRENAIPMPLCRIDLNNDTVKTVYTPTTSFPHVIGMDNGMLYFYENGQVVADKQVYYEYNMYRLDVSTDKVEELGKIPDEVGKDISIPLFVRDGELYYTALNKLMKCDMSFENVTELYDCGTSYLNQWFYDEITDELYFSLTNDEEQSGSVMVLKDGEVREVELASGAVYSFCLTRDKIYYSTYDPIYYGVSSTAYYFKRDPEECKVYDQSGGKVYAVDRNELSETELVYDCAGEYVICTTVSGYVVLGDNLYFDEIAIVNETLDGVEYTYFSYASDLSKMRVNLTTGEMTRIRFE